MSNLNLSEEEKNQIREKHQAAIKEYRDRIATEKNGLKAPKSPEKPAEEKK